MSGILKISVFAVMLLCTTIVWAQTDETVNQVMQKIDEALSSGDCDRAKRAYNVWKVLMEQTNNSIEGKINDCQKVKYNKIYEYKEDFAKVELNGKYGFIDKTGEEVIPCIYDDVHDFKDGLALVGNRENEGYVYFILTKQENM